MRSEAFTIRKVGNTMNILHGNAIVGQSGGPTAAINATLAGVIRGALDEIAKENDANGAAICRALPASGMATIPKLSKTMRNRRLSMVCSFHNGFFLLIILKNNRFVKHFSHIVLPSLIKQKKYRLSFLIIS